MLESIWSDLYEQHSPLLRDNQLLCAIIQKDTQEGKLRLQCRWLSDLTRDPQDILPECQTAFDLAKSLAKSFAQKEKKRSEKSIEEGKKMKNRLRMTLDADLMRLSHILAIKEVFRSYPGAIAIEIEFVSAKGKVGSVQIDSAWGVEDHPALEKKMHTLRAIKSLEWE